MREIDQHHIGASASCFPATRPLQPFQTFEKVMQGFSPMPFSPCQKNMGQEERHDLPEALVSFAKSSVNGNDDSDRNDF